MRCTCWISIARIAAWYAGATRIYGYSAEEMIEQHVSVLYPGDDTIAATLREEFDRAAAEGHTGTEGWQARKDGSRFWANSITMALLDAEGELQGYARAVRDFTERHDRRREVTPRPGAHPAGADRIHHRRRRFRRVRPHSRGQRRFSRPGRL